MFSDFSFPPSKTALKKGYPMRLDRILQVFLPHHDRFYRHFEESIRFGLAAANTLLDLAKAPRHQWPELVRRIQELEHQGDNITHWIHSELSGTFVTPFDPEDIHELATTLDDILDIIDGSARRLILYKIDSCPPDMILLIQSLRDSIADLALGVGQLSKLNKVEELQAIIRRIRDHEDAADIIFSRAVADLFEAGLDPIEIIKLKEIYVTLETATDVCQDASDVLEAIMIKHA
jgi:uncharacterized protein